MKRDTQLILACLMVSVFAGVLTQVGAAYASRNGSGTYALPTGNPVVTGTAISSTTHNSTMADLATEMTDSLNRSGKGAMLAGLQGYVGTVSLPGYTFAGDTNTGLYWVSADTFAAGAGGVNLQTWTDAAATRIISMNASVAITGHTAQALYVQGVAGTDAITAQGSTTGGAVTGVGGATNGVGGSFTAGGGNANGVNGVASGSGAGVHGNGSTSGYGLFGTGNATRAPLHIVPSAAPATPAEGDLYGNSTDHKLYYYTGSAWVVVGTQT